MIYSIAFQGLPAYREEKLDNDTGTFFYHIKHGEDKKKSHEIEELPGASTCPQVGCVDYTLPIGMNGRVSLLQSLIPIFLKSSLKLL